MTGPGPAAYDVLTAAGARKVLHVCVCENGHETFTGDAEHHVTNDSVGAGHCGSRLYTIMCPPGCFGAQP